MRAAASASEASWSDKLLPPVITERSANEVSQNQANSPKESITKPAENQVDL